MIVVWRILLLAAAAFLAWQVVAFGLGGYYAERMRAGDDSAVDQVLAWQSGQPEALFLQGARLMADDPEQAQALLSRAYRANPTDPRPLIVLANRFAADGETERADALMEVVTTLTPVDPRIQRQLAAYWAGREDGERALRHLSTVMEADPAQRRELVPTLLKIAEDPNARVLLAPYALSPPPWWDYFFKHTARHAETLEPVRFLYNLRRKPDAAPLTDDERDAYVARLQKEERVSEAYLVWLNGLDEDERQHLGLLNNGGFELDLSNQGFGWRVGRNDRVEIRTAATYDALGKRALKLTFRANEGRFWHLFQPLFLDAGSYRLSGKTRGEGFDSKGGLKWRVRCLAPQAKLLGESEQLFGSRDWSAFAFDFDMPADCTVQELRLVSGGTRAFELKASGDLWIDAMQIVRNKPPAEPDATP